MTRHNEHGQPIGPDLGEWRAPGDPPRQVLAGRSVTLRPVVPDEDAEAMFGAFADSPASTWTYLSYGPFADATELSTLLAYLDDLPDWQVHAIDVGGSLLGFICYLRIAPGEGVIEIGGVTFSSALRRTRAATEAVHLLIANAFDLGYRRVEWKCDSLNEPSRRAADRFGFTYEGTFRQATHYRGRNRDTAWYSIIDQDWPAIDAEFRRWLADDNFDDAGDQRTRLAVPRPTPES